MIPRLKRQEESWTRILCGMYQMLKEGNGTIYLNFGIIEIKIRGNVNTIPNRGVTRSNKPFLNILAAMCFSLSSVCILSLYYILPSEVAAKGAGSGAIRVCVS